MIAGLEEITCGEIWIGDKLVNGVPPKDRDIAMVFQNYALYPHMTVYQNMAFGLKLRNYPKKEIDGRVREAAEILNLTHLLERKPKELSGGQRQRVAVGRAIVRKPKVFLFDEPLSNLDAKLRVQMRTEISKLHDRLQTTMIYVTHDQVEAMTMGDRICVMKDGMIMQVDRPLEIYNKPGNKFVASFIGSPPMNFMDVQVVRRAGTCCLDEGKFILELLPSMEEAVAPYVGKDGDPGRPPGRYLRQGLSPATSPPQAARRFPPSKSSSPWAAKSCSISTPAKIPWSPASNPRAKPKSTRKSKSSSTSKRSASSTKNTQERIL